MHHPSKDIGLDETTDSLPEPLRSLAVARGLLIGTAVDMGALTSDTLYTDTLVREFNMVVAENAFKPSEVWIAPEEYDFTQTDRLADFAEQHGMVLRGHTLVWHQQTPSWLTPDAGYSAETLHDLLRAYIHAVVGRYRGRIAMWDVVNEAFTDPEADAESSLREDSPWYRALGPNYIRLAFQWAHEADPAAKLYYNDYEIEETASKSNAIYGLLSQLVAEGVPIHGIGFQAHLENGWRATESHRENIRRFAALGLDWQFTEADIRMFLDGAAPTAEQLAIQAGAYRDLTALCLDEPNCRGMVFWGFTDARSWIPGFRPGWGASLPLDEEYQPKPAFVAISEALTQK